MLVHHAAQAIMQLKSAIVQIQLAFDPTDLYQNYLELVNPLQVVIGDLENNIDQIWEQSFNVNSSPVAQE